MSSQTLVQLVERVHAQAVCPPRRAAEGPGARHRPLQRSAVSPGQGGRLTGITSSIYHR